MTPNNSDVPDVIDLQFALSGKQVPQDYAEALWQGVRAVLPWLETDAASGIHPLSGLSPGEGVWYLSRRSRLTLRIPRHREPEAATLSGSHLDFDGEQVTVGAPAGHELRHASVLYAKFVTYSESGSTSNIADEQFFFKACSDELATLGMHPRLLCGKSRYAATPAGVLKGFSLMVLGLDQADTLRLQRHGLGLERKRGCGIFVPHKSMASVVTLE